LKFTNGRNGPIKGELGRANGKRVSGLGKSILWEIYRGGFSLWSSFLTTCRETCLGKPGVTLGGDKRNKRTTSCQGATGISVEKRDNEEKIAG